MKYLVTICARRGSKGISGKNIKILNGKPLIEYTIDVANEFKKFYKSVDVVLSSDSMEIISVAETCGLHSNYKRPAYLATDKAGKVDAIADVVKYAEKAYCNRYDYVLDLDVTSPLRTLKDLSDSLGIIESNKNAINLFSVSECSRNPYFNMVEKKNNGYYAQVKRLPANVLTRQSAPKVYDMNASFYFYRREFFDLGYNGPITDKSLIYVMPHICFDLDHPMDFEIISYLILNNKLDFSL